MIQSQKPVIVRKSNRIKKLERIATRRTKLTHDTVGEGLYVYQNTTSGDLMLGKPIIVNGQEIDSIGIGKKWEGDNYYMYLVESHMAKCISEITSPETQRTEKMLNEEKLILDQPNRVTNKGVTEQVIVPTPVKLAVAKPKINEEAPEDGILLVEDPLEGVQILG